MYVYIQLIPVSYDRTCIAIAEPGEENIYQLIKLIRHVCLFIVILLLLRNHSTCSRKISRAQAASITTMDACKIVSKRARATLIPPRGNTRREEYKRNALCYFCDQLPVQR